MKKKYFTSWDDEDSKSKCAEDLAKEILNDPDLPQIKSIVIGAWSVDDMFDTTPDEIFEMIVSNKEKFQHIESLFVGAMGFEDCEISWICQGDYEELLNALPNLKSLKIKGANNRPKKTFKLGKVDHKNLEKLVIKCSGLPVEVVESLKVANLPNLKKLVLYLGGPQYGYDCKISDFAALANKSLFPNLNELGFVNSKQQDEIVQVILDSDILPQLTTIRISCGCLTDKGGQLILDAAEAGKLSNVKKLDAEYHYMSGKMMIKLKALPFKVNVSDSQEPHIWREGEEGDMYPMITE
ncbi:MAG: cytoplasmic protein [Defluviitaleaceae bacterium]|nr:cytoplasmic protein [Defluviitaleaceae bacterium]